MRVYQNESQPLICFYHSLAYLIYKGYLAVVFFFSTKNLWLKVWNIHTNIAPLRVKFIRNRIIKLWEFLDSAKSIQV